MGEILRDFGSERSGDYEDSAGCQLGESCTRVERELSRMRTNKAVAP